jgi:hypothetical protein
VTADRAGAGLVKEFHKGVDVIAAVYIINIRAVVRGDLGALGPRDRGEVAAAGAGRGFRCVCVDSIHTAHELCVYSSAI